MPRTFACLTLLLLAASAFAQPQPGEPIPLTVSAAALPTPSLKYRLLPDRRDLTPGNAATLYYRSEALFYENGELLQDVKGGAWSTWASMPLKELPLAEIRTRLGSSRHLLDELDVAARRRECDWNLEQRPEGAGLLLPEVQSFRALALVLAVRARLHIAEGRFAEAVQALQTGYALARHLGEGPTLIHVLVGAALANIMTAQLEELIQQPNAPNLAWALAVVPQPFLDPRNAMHEESTMLERTLPSMKRLEGGVMTLAEVRLLQEEIKKALGLFGLKEPTLADTLALTALQLATYPEAKKALLAQGEAAEQVEAMPAFQVVGLYAWREYRAGQEEYFKWFKVPGGWRDPNRENAAKKFRAASARIDRFFFRGLVGGLADLAVDKVFGAIARTDRRLAALRCVEAVRLYAAAHGKPPGALSDLTEVPIPLDPYTGKAFTYEVKEDKVRLSAPPPPGDKPPPYLLLTYEVTIRR